MFHLHRPASLLLPCEKLAILKRKLQNYSYNNFEVKLLEYQNSTSLASADNTISLAPRTYEGSIGLMAAVLAHEWEHLILGHVRTDQFQVHIKQQEIEADAYSAIFLALHGYSLEPIKQYFSQHYSRYESEHLKAPYRIDLLERYYDFAKQRLCYSHHDEILEYILEVSFQEFFEQMSQPLRFGIPNSYRRVGPYSSSLF